MKARRRGRVVGATLLGLVLFAAPVNSQLNAPQLWKAKALEAGEKLQTLQKRLHALRERWNSQQANEAKCEAMLETAFAMHLTHESIAHKVLRSGWHAFKIILNGGEQGLFDLTYIYDPATWNLTPVEVLSLPHAWELIHPVGDARKLGARLLVVKDSSEGEPRCVFGFSQEAPFFAHVSRSSK
jgi:hypothetical protein